MANTYTSLFYHIVFSTKNRLPLIHPSFRDDLYKYMDGIIRNIKGTLIEIGGISDHIHLLLNLKTDTSLAETLKHIKSSSSKWIHDHHSKLIWFNWQDGYGAFTVSPLQLDRVARYIQNQEQHHRNKTFQDEYLMFLKKYKIKFDERYLWN